MPRCRALTRFEFLEVTLRYARELYLKTGKAPNLATAYGQLMAHVIANVPKIVHHKPNDFRELMLNSEELHHAFKKHERWLHVVFNHMCANVEASSRRSDEITLESFEYLLHNQLEITSEVRLCAKHCANAVPM